MSDINWKDGAVCYTDAGQWVLSEVKKTLKRAKGERRVGFEQALNQHDFKLNEIREGDFIPASELDTEQKYNEVIEVFGLFGHESDSQSGYDGLVRGAFARLTIRKTGFSNVKLNFDCKRQLTYHQIIAIGKLKRMMLEREKSNPPEFTDSSKRNKSKQAYDILKSLDYEYDLVKQRWFKKQYID